MIIGESQQYILTAITQNSAAREKSNGQNLPFPTPQTESVITDFEMSGSVSEIVKEYDVRNMSPREMSAMSQKLYQNGSISFFDHSLLSFQPELGAGFTGASYHADNPRDFIAHWERQLEFHEQQGNSVYAEHDRRILNILGNLEVLSRA